MTAKSTRREFLVGTGGIAFGLVVLGTPRALHTAEAGEPLIPNAWLTIAPSGEITIYAVAAEMGQGSFHSLPVVVAEELDADWDDVRIEFSPSDDALYGHPEDWTGGIMITVASASLPGYYQTLRLQGAQARRVLLEAAAASWGVEVRGLRTEPSVVVDPASGRRLRYGEIAALGWVPESAPQVGEKDLKDPRHFRLIGRDLPRRDIPRKTDGTAPYSIDVRLPGMLYATIVLPPYPAATPAQVDDEGALAQPGMLRAVPLASGIACVANTYEAALAGERALEVTWKHTREGLRFDSETAPDEHLAAARDLARGGFVLHQQGDTATALESAAVQYTGEYKSDLVYHAQMEPLNAVARVRSDGVELWAGTQAPTHCQREVAKALGISTERVILHRTLLGGGFGRRAAKDHDYAVEAALLAQVTGKPVKVIWSRETDVRAGRFKPITGQYLRAGFDAEGQLVALHHRVASDEAVRHSDESLYPGHPVTAADGLMTADGLLYSHEIPNLLTEVVALEVPVRLSPVRGVGATNNLFALESFLDEIAASRGVDPLAFRLRLLQQAPLARTVLEKATQMARWPRQGLGLSFVAMKDGVIGTVVEVSLDRETGRIHVPKVWIAADVGIPIQPDNVIAQIEGATIYALSNLLREKISFRNGAIEQSNFHDCPLLSMRDAPEIEVHVVRSLRDPAGIGDFGGVGVAPAVANAVASISGVRLRHIPFLPDRVRATLNA